MIWVPGSINQDTFLFPKSLPRDGETVISETIINKLGGKGANSAIAASLATNKTVHFIGGVGDDDAAHFIGEALEKYDNLAVDLTVIPNCSSGRAFINVDKQGENQIIIVPGANFKAFDSKMIEKIPQNPDFLICNFEIPENFVLEIFEKISEKTKKILNFSPISKNLEIVRKILKLTDYLILNEIEADFLKNELDLVKNVVLTKGSKGASLLKNGVEVFKFEAPKIQPVSTVGTGDCFLGTFVASLDDGFSEEDSIQRAIAAASSCCLKHGAADSYEKLEKILKY